MTKGQIAGLAAALRCFEAEGASVEDIVTRLTEDFHPNDALAIASKASGFIGNDLGTLKRFRECASLIYSEFGGR